MKKKSTNEADAECICRAEFFYKDQDGEEWVQWKKCLYLTNAVKISWQWSLHEEDIINDRHLSHVSKNVVLTSAYINEDFIM